MYGFFQNGGGVCWIVRVGAAGGRAGAAQAALPAAADSAQEALRAVAREGVEGDIEVTISEDPSAAKGEDETATTYSVSVTAGSESEEFEGLSLKKGRNYIVTKVNAGSQAGQLEETGASLPEASARRAPTSCRCRRLRSRRWTPATFEGDVARREGIGGLAAIDEVTMVCALT